MNQESRTYDREVNAKPNDSHNEQDQKGPNDVFDHSDIPNLNSHQRAQKVSRSQDVVSDSNNRLAPKVNRPEHEVLFRSHTERIIKSVNNRHSQEYY